jgi:hypothetical protein
MLMFSRVAGRTPPPTTTDAQLMEVGRCSGAAVKAWTDETATQTATTRRGAEKDFILVVGCLRGGECVCKVTKYCVALVLSK